jgi:hypothetical protein
MQRLQILEEMQLLHSSKEKNILCVLSFVLA